MASYQIISSAGADMGTYEGATAREAVEAMWTDAGVEGSDALFAELTVRRVAGTWGIGTLGGGVIEDGYSSREAAVERAQEAATERGETLYVWRSGRAGGPEDVAVEPESDEASK